MINDRQQHWDEKWMLRRAADAPALCELLLKYQAQLTPGRALDVACGLGQNAIWLAQHGWRVEAIDISPVALERARANAAQANVPVHFIQADVIEYAWPVAAYDLILVRRFLERQLLPVLRRALAPGGWLFYETFNQRKRITQRDFPAAYLLGEGELRQVFCDLDCIEAGDDGGAHGEVSWLVARCPA
jgi:SAM-dependent methyltransferase